MLCNMSSYYSNLISLANYCFQRNNKRVVRKLSEYFTSDVAIFGDAANFLVISKPCYFLTPLRKYQPEVSNKTMSNVRAIGFSVFISTLNSLADVVLHIKICSNSTINTQD